MLERQMEPRSEGSAPLREFRSRFLLSCDAVSYGIPFSNIIYVPLFLSHGMANTLTHIAHDHSLVLLTNQSSHFICDGCESSGSGPRYHCSSCNLDLHEFCAKCPEHISFFGHPHHRLDLVPEVVWKNFPRYGKGASCDICSESVGGMIYRCDKCDFDIHPLCSLLPLTVTGAPAHPEHELALVPRLPSVCKVCSGNTKVWNYRCASCCIDLHPQCVGEIQAKAEGQSSAPIEQHKGQSPP